MKTFYGNNINGRRCMKRQCWRSITTRAIAYRRGAIACRRGAITYRRRVIADCGRAIAYPRGAIAYPRGAIVCPSQVILMAALGRALPTFPLGNSYSFSPDDDLLEKLLALNLELAEKEKKGEAVVGPWDPTQSN